MEARIKMDTKTTKTQYIDDTIFQDDNAVLRLISLFESGEIDFKLATSIENIVMDAKMVREKNGEFLVKFDLLPQWNDKFEMNHFFERPVMLVTNGVNMLIKNTDVTKFKQTIGEDVRQACININAFRGDIDDKNWRHSKQAAYFRFDCSIFHAYNCGVIYDMTTNKDQNSTWKNCMKIEIDKSAILFYYVQIEENLGYFVFKTNDPIDHDKFLHIINSIRAAFALISGFYIADSAYFISMQKGKSNTLTYRYENFNETIHSQRPLLDNSFYRDIPQDELRLTSNQFERLSKLLYMNEELLRSCVLLTQASNVDNLSKGCLAAVALETITNKIVDKGTNTSVLIEDKGVYRQLKYELEKAINKIRNNIEKPTFDKLKSKIGKINEQSNSTKLGTPFETLGISLNEEEQYCISCRNYLLHGSLPTPTSELFKTLTKDELLKLVSYRLIMLSSMLILKKIGYEYYVIDWGYTEIAIKRMMMNCKSIKGLGRAHRLIGN